MKKLTVVLLFLLLLGKVVAFNQPVTPADMLPDYYARIDGMSGKQLLDSIQKVAKIGYRTTDFRYDSIWFAFQHTDIRPDGYIWEIYSGCDFVYEEDRASATTQTGECKGYNREHSICQSWFTEYDLNGNKMSSSMKNSPGSDIFHIYPTSYGMNSRRGNRPYGEVNSAEYTSLNGTKYGIPKMISVENSVAGQYVEGKVEIEMNVLEPIDEYKGDIARGYFGTMVKWAGEWAFNKADEGRQIFDKSIDLETLYAEENNYGLTNYGLAMLLKWHRQDPVSQKEIDRNNGIQKTQGNRNPFIDYPYLVEYIWGEKSGEKVDIDQLLCSADESFVLGESNGFIDDLEIIYDTIYWMVNNDVYETTIIKRGAKLNQLPQTPKSCSITSDVFCGWTNNPIEGTSDQAPEILYQQATNIPKTSGNNVYYAVFATQLSLGIQEQTIILSKNDSTEWELNNLKYTTNKTDGDYWILTKEASIISPQMNLNDLDSITMRLRTYYNYGTVRISLNNDSIGCLTAATTSMDKYVWVSPQLTEYNSLIFTSVGGTATRGVGVQEISIYLSDEPAVYTNYITHCDENLPTDYSSIQQDVFAHKVFRDGRLYIQIQGLLYDSMGRVIK